MSPKRTRCRYKAEFKDEVALAALTERPPLAELAARYQLAPAQIRRWKLHLRQQAAQVFAEVLRWSSNGGQKKDVYFFCHGNQIQPGIARQTTQIRRGI